MTTTITAPPPGIQWGPPAGASEATIPKLSPKERAVLAGYKAYTGTKSLVRAVAHALTWPLRQARAYIARHENLNTFYMMVEEALIVMTAVLIAYMILVGAIVAVFSLIGLLL